ncbi:MAG: sulfotransferase [Gammaproteobacteria bacterium]|nr:sulfotransferase [Gammaproteobacteria bacterium]NNM01829.1 sulfotransferase [Gammaproteobacteria bacterium]
MNDGLPDAGSAAGKRLLFLLGPPRCGSTWLQLALSRSPAVCTVQETHLFSAYLRGPVQAWERHADNPRAIGLRHQLDEAFFVARIKAFADAVFERLGEQCAPEARVFLEKTPAHIEHREIIERLYPDAWFLVLVRDPRDMVASMQRAGRSWGRWAGSGVIANAMRWQRNVSAALELEQEVTHYKRVRYEDMRGNGSECLAGIFDWLGIEHSAGEIDTFLAEVDRPKLRNGQLDGAPWDIGGEPEGFYGGGGGSAPAAPVSAANRRLVETLTAPGMAALGYPREFADARWSPRLALYRAGERAAALLARLGRRL